MITFSQGVQQKIKSKQFLEFGSRTTKLGCFNRDSQVSIDNYAKDAGPEVV